MNPAPVLTDPFDSSLLNQFNPERRPAEHALFSTPLWRALRQANGYEMHIQTIPDERNVALAGRNTYTLRFYQPHGSFLVAISAASDDAAGFSAQIQDLGNGGVLYAAPLHNTLIAPADTADEEDNNGLIHYLTIPRPILSPGLIGASITNLAADPNRLQLALWFFRPTGEQFEPNEANALLAAVLQNQARYLASAGSSSGSFYSSSSTASSSTTAAGGASYPWEVMPPNSQPLRQEETIDTPALGVIDAPVIEYIVPPGYTAALKKHWHEYHGAGFVNGSGDIIWRLTVDGAAPPGYDDMRTLVNPTYGEISGAILARSGQTIRYTVTAVNLTGAQTTCGFLGYLYPQQ